MLRTGETTAKALRVDRVHERPLTVDLDHGQPLAVPPLELRIARDVDLVEVELAFVREDAENTTRPVAQVTTGRVEERDARRCYGYRPLVVVASATRMTARP